MIDILPIGVWKPAKVSSLPSSPVYWSGESLHHSAPICESHTWASKPLQLSNTCIYMIVNFLYHCLYFIAKIIIFQKLHCNLFLFIFQLLQETLLIHVSGRTNFHYTLFSLHCLWLDYSVLRIVDKCFLTISIIHLGRVLSDGCSSRKGPLQRNS